MSLFRAAVLIAGGFVAFRVIASATRTEAEILPVDDGPRGNPFGVFDDEADVEHEVTEGTARSLGDPEPVDVPVESRPTDRTAVIPSVEIERAARDAGMDRDSSVTIRTGGPGGGVI